MKKLATKLLVCSLTCSLLISGYQASASTCNLDDGSTASLTLKSKDLKCIVKDTVEESIDDAVEEAILTLARDEKSVQNIVREIKKTSKGSTLWEIVKFPFSAAWNVVTSVVVLALALALLVGGTYAFAPSSREAIKTDLNNLLNTLKNSNSANKVSKLAKSAYKSVVDYFSTGQQSSACPFWKKWLNHC